MTETHQADHRSAAVSSTVLQFATGTYLDAQFEACRPEFDRITR